MRSLLVSLLALSVLLAACGSAGPAADGPEAVVQDALAKVAASDLDGLRGLACAGQEDLIRDQLSLTDMAGAGDLLGGVDLDALLAAVRIDVAAVKIEPAAIEGETATVPLAGSLNVTFDAEAMRPIVRQLLESQGTTISEEQVDALVKTLESYGQAVPVDQSIRLVREGGDWKICQETLEAPATP
jgi:hypothetical protein